MVKKIKIFFTLYRSEIIIYVSALSVQLIFFFLALQRFGPIKAWQIMVPPDADEYIKLGVNLYAHRVFSLIQNAQGMFLPEAVRPPLYPLFIAVFYAVAEKLWVVSLVQNFILALMPVLVYRLGNLLWNNKKISFLAALLFLLEPERAVMASQLVSDLLFGFLLLLSFYYFIRFERGLGENKKMNLVLMSLFIGLAALVRPIGVIMILGYPCLWVIRGCYDHHWKKRIFSAVILIGIFYLTILPWLWRNYKTFGHLALSSSGGYALYLENVYLYNEHRLGLRGAVSEKVNVVAELIQKFRQANDIPDNVSDYFLERYTMRDFKYTGYYNQVFGGIMKRDPWGYIGFHLYRLAPFFIDAKYSYIATKILPLPISWGYPYLFWLGRLPWALAVIIIISGLWHQVITKGFRKFPWETLLTVFLIFGFALASAAHGGSSRLRQPINAYIFLLLAYVLVYFKDWVKQRNLVK